MHQPDLTTALHALREWQHDGAPVQLHPGDLGWQWRFGAETTAAAVRGWSRDGRLFAVGFIDSPGLLRLAIAPAADHDRELAAVLATDLTGDELALTQLEARSAVALRELLQADGWVDDESWTPLSRSLADPVADCGLRIELIGPDRAPVRTAVHRAAFGVPTFTDERWRTMAAGPAYADACCLVGFDEHGAAVAAATVWSAGPGRPGLLEPVGVHPDHRGHGYGTAISIAAAATLRELGSSAATVCTPTANAAAVATYRAAGFTAQPEALDLRRGVTE